MGKNCSIDREKLLKFEAEGQEFANFLRSLEQSIQTERSEKCLVTKCFFNLFLENELEQLEFKLLGFRNMQEKLENVKLVLKSF